MSRLVNDLRMTRLWIGLQRLLNQIFLLYQCVLSCLFARGLLYSLDRSQL